MDLPKVIVKDNYNEYLNGKEVKAILLGSSSRPLEPGSHVIAFKDSIATASDIPVPKQQQAHYIGVEGTVIELEIISGNNSNHSEKQLVKIKKLPA